MRQKYFLVALLSALFVGFTFLFHTQPSPSQQKMGKFEFALIGDLPYNDSEEAKFFNLLEEINRSKLAFVVHDGDIKNGYSVCSDEVFKQRKQLFQRFVHPLIFIFGDNEWTDCYRENNGKYDPIERLAKIRAIFTQGNKSLGKNTLQLTRQSDNPQYGNFRENVRWIYRNVMFLGLNMPGSNNNFGRTTEADQEYVERNQANLAWMKESFALAKGNGNKGIMLVIQANPYFELEPNDKNRTGYNDFITTLEAETKAFGKQVVLVHGDTHYFRIDKPLPTWIGDKKGPRMENFTRVETFGSPDVHWVSASVDPTDPNLFQFKPMIIDKNRVYR